MTFQADSQPLSAREVKIAMQAVNGDWLVGDDEREEKLRCLTALLTLSGSQRIRRHMNYHHQSDISSRYQAPSCA